MKGKGYKFIIFDLDGTLLDTSQGIFNSVRYAEKKMGLEPVAEEDLKKFVGPPPAEMYGYVYGLSDKQSLEAARYHREYGSSRAIYEARLYDGVGETLAYLSAQGYLLAVATLKRQDIAEKVLALHGIDKYFIKIAGMNQSESDTKAGLIKKVCNAVGMKPCKEVLMVGDSMYDLEGAEEAGVDFLGVTYGFGFKGNEEDVCFIDRFPELEVDA